jgi:hypothetical protein
MKNDMVRRLAVGVMVFNATFNNISAISWRLVLLVEETGESQSQVTDKLYRIIMYRVVPDEGYSYLMKVIRS